MKRLVVALLLVATAAVGQDKKPEPQPNTVREYKTRIFEIKNRDPRVIADALHLLGSGFGGSGISVNTELKTITVRDFPENIATMDEAIKRLDQPAPAAPDIEFKISVLIGSKSPLNAASVPEDLEPVVKQLQSTLRYAHYGLMTAAVQRTKPGEGIEGSGVAEPTLLGMTPNQERPVFYSYNLRRITSTPSGIDIEKFAFSMRVPIVVRSGSGEIQYQNVGFETPVSLREKEKVVIGTTTMGDKALIVVVTATR
jgi:hypothetical protein